MKRFLLLVAFGSIMMITLAVASNVWANSPPLLTEYPVGGSPLYVSVEAPGRVWFTLPGQNAIGRLVVTSTTDYSVVTYTVPTANSQPYDLKYAGGAVWFAELSGNKIGRLDPGSGAIAEFPVPTLGSQPAGIDVLPGNPTTVWFTERSGNKLGRLVVTSTMDYLFAEYPLPSDYSDAQPEDIHIQNTDSIWFTAPGANRIGNFKPSIWPQSDAFRLVYTGGGSQPWAIKVEGFYPWFTERAGNRIGQFFPQTIADFRWYTLPFPSSDPYDLAIGAGYIWFTENAGNRIGQLHPTTGRIWEFGLPSGSAPKGLAVDANACVWVAESGRNRIAQWCPPYFRYVYLPLVLRNSP
jgi:virginiamycin B lyase